MTLAQRIITIFSYIFLLFIISLSACLPFTIETTPVMMFVAMPILLIVLLTVVLIVDQMVTRRKLKVMSSVRNNKTAPRSKQGCTLLFGLCRHFR